MSDRRFIGNILFRPCKHVAPVHCHWLTEESSTVFECTGCKMTWTNESEEDITVDDLFKAGYKLEFVGKGTEETRLNEYAITTDR